jgi:hypothetical protein
MVRPPARSATTQPTVHPGGDPPRARSCHWGSQQDSLCVFCPTESQPMRSTIGGSRISGRVRREVGQMSIKEQDPKVQSVGELPRAHFLMSDGAEIEILSAILTGHPARLGRGRHGVVGSGHRPPARSAGELLLGRGKPTRAAAQRRCRPAQSTRAHVRDPKTSVNRRPKSAQPRHRAGDLSQAHPGCSLFTPRAGLHAPISLKLTTCELQ